MNKIIVDGHKYNFKSISKLQYMVYTIRRMYDVHKDRYESGYKFMIDKFQRMLDQEKPQFDCVCETTPNCFIDRSLPLNKIDEISMTVKPTITAGVWYIDIDLYIPLERCVSFESYSSVEKNEPPTLSCKYTNIFDVKFDLSRMEKDVGFQPCWNKTT